jgi:hypothetical protein
LCVVTNAEYKGGVQFSQLSTSHHCDVFKLVQENTGVHCVWSPREAEARVFIKLLIQ